MVQQLQLLQLYLQSFFLMDLETLLLIKSLLLVLLVQVLDS